MFRKKTEGADSNGVPNTPVETVVPEAPKPRRSILSDSVPLVVGGLLIVGAFAASRYKIASPSQYIIKTGIGIKDIDVSKRTVVWPFQRYEILDITPKNFSFVLHAMSHEKMEFQLPVHFTIGPYNDEHNLREFAMRLSNLGQPKLEELVKGIIEGGTRSMAANLSIEDIFKDRIKFKSDIKATVQQDLNQFGLQIYNANIKEMQDTEGSEYFVYLRQKTKEGAINQAKIEVAEARLRGDVGEKEKLGETRRRNAKIEAETVTFENEREQEKVTSIAQLEKIKAQNDREVQIVQIEAQKAAAIREAELQKLVEIKRLEQEVERLRADTLSLAMVNAEAQIKAAEGEALSQQKLAEAQLYQKQKEAEGIAALLKAQAQGLDNLRASSGGDFKNVISYLMVEKGVYPKIAEETAKAIQGLNPKITVWNTNDGNGSNDPVKTVRDIFKSLPPLMNTIEEQTGIRPPEWMMKMPEKPTTPPTEMQIPTPKQ